MIRKLSVWNSFETNPWNNLALEEALLRCVLPEECILYLWQNRRTVVVGRNQNCWKECHVAGLEADGGFLARRLSGGGAVFHDLGNLNFTFLTSRENFDESRQTGGILRAVRGLGIAAEKTGRNDLTVENRKFSGNAYYLTKNGCYQHGTLLIRSDAELMSRYLTVSREKLRSKSVESVRSRVCNLADYCPGLTVEQVRTALPGAFGGEYGVRPEPFAFSRIGEDELAALRKKYASPEWKYGRKIPFDYEIARRFPWGEVQLQFLVRDGAVQDCCLFTDALETDYPSRLRAAFSGAAFTAASMQGALESCVPADERQAGMQEDIAALLRESM